MKIRSALPLILVIILVLAMSCTSISITQKGRNLPRPIPQETPRTFVFECEQNYKFTARLADEQAWLFLPGKTVSLSPVTSGAGSKYSDGKFSFWKKGDEARLDIAPDKHHVCRNNRYLAIWEHAKFNGIDFRAVGNEPGWYLEVSKGRKLLFVSDYGQSRYAFDAPEPTSDVEKRTTIYRAQSNEHSLEIVISGQPCRDTMRGDAFESTVTVTLGNQTYRGCGKALH